MPVIWVPIVMQKDDGSEGVNVFIANITYDFALIFVDLYGNRLLKSKDFIDFIVKIFTEGGFDKYGYLNKQGEKMIIAFYHSYVDYVWEGFYEFKNTLPVSVSVN